MTYRIRRATEQDAETLLKLRRCLFAETAFSLTEPDEFIASSEEECDRIRYFNTAPNSLLLLAESGSEAIGFLTANGQDKNRVRHVAFVGMSILRQHWGQGVGSLLLQEVFKWSARAGIKRLEGNVQASNLRAIALYLRSGFHFEGVRRYAIRVNGQYAHEYSMVRFSDMNNEVSSDEDRNVSDE